MNRKNTILTATILISFFGVVAAASAVASPSPGITPDSPFYFLKTWKESIQTFFTFGLENKARQYLRLAEIRLTEYQKMTDKGNTKAAGKTLKKYEKQLDRALQKAEQMKQRGKDVKDVFQKIEEKITKHNEVLEQNLQKAPEAAKKGLENAIESSGKAIEKIKKELKKDETAGWKTYRNEEYGFEVKYPETIAGTGIKQRFIFQKFNPRLPEIFVGTIGTAEVPGLHLIGFRIERKPSGFINLDTYLKEIKDECQKEISGGAAGGVCNIKKITVGNEEIPAIVTTESSAVVNTSVALYFDKGSDIFLVSYDFARGMLDAGDIKEKILFNTIQQILSTFRFIEEKKSKDETVKPITASLGEQFILKKKQIAKIANTGLEIEITEFYNSPCPPKVQCVWSGVGIGFEYRFNGQIKKGIDLVQAFGFQTNIIKTDYETYANLVVEKIK